MKIKFLVRKLLIKYGLPFDLLFFILIIPCGYLLLIFRMIGAKQLPRTAQCLKKIGVFPIRNHYYEPLFDHSLLSRPLSEDRYLPGINLNVDAQTKLLSELTYANEILDLKLDQKPTTIESFYINNGAFDAGDAEFLYQFIRRTKPKKIIEIGSGNSTKIARLALIKSKEDAGVNCNHICIEPYEMPWLEDLQGVTIIRERIEECAINWSTELDSGDLLFIDSSHIIRPQGDVLAEYLQIFPQLKPGVHVHIHDIFTPKDYPKSWVIDDVKFWNEQYMLEALLTDTPRYKVIAALNYLKHNHFDNLLKVCPYMTDNHEPGSFYFSIQ